VIGGLSVGYIAAHEARHVTGSAIGIISVMLGGKFFGMARDTFRAVIIHALGGRWSAVRIMARGAMQRFAGFAFAGALRQGFKLADGPGIGLAIGRENQVVNVVGKIVAGLELVEMLSGLLDCGVSF